jgi:hypothetical protein
MAEVSDFHVNLIGLGCGHMDTFERHGELIRLLEKALATAEEIDDAATGYLIERALDQARGEQFRFPTS